MQLECNVSPSQGAITAVAGVIAQEIDRVLGEASLPHGAPGTHPRRDSLVPLSNLPGIHEIDAILRPVVKAGRKEVHEAIEKILQGWPGRRRGELWARLRQLRNKGRGSSRHRAVWTEEDLEILRANYAQGRAGARRGVRELLARNPNRSARSICDKARKLGISTGTAKPKPWTPEELGDLLWNAGEKPVRRIARKLGRSEKAVFQMLSSHGATAKVRVPKNYNLHRLSKLLGVSDRAVRLWFQRGLFGEAASQGKKQGRSQDGPHLSREAIVAFCMKHPDRINAECCDPDLLLMIEDKRVLLPGWHGSRQHLVQARCCPRCGRVIRGNSYFRHVKRCPASPASAGKIEPESVAADQPSSGSKA